MAIEVQINTNYGGVLVNQKYSPLENIRIGTGDADLCSAVVTHRWNLLRGAGMLPERLTLVVSDWHKLVNRETGTRPPLVVISTNRSAWIAQGFRMANREASRIDGARFENVSDLRALEARVDGVISSPPIYCPKRLGDAGPRNVFIVVHAHEYATYAEALKGQKDVTVIGWQFREPNSRRRLCGFGASRYAAIEFCKTLRLQATRGTRPPWDSAWLFDDNVVALTGFAGFAAAEAMLTNTDSGGPHACIGFHGCAAVDAFSEIRRKAREAVAAGRGRQPEALPTEPAHAGVVQQAALWNLRYLTENHLNFGPAFVASGEDVSLANYFNSQHVPYLFYTGIGVLKEDPTADDSAGAREVARARRILMKWFGFAESAGAPAALPPPVRVEAATTLGGVQTVGTFITDRVLPVSSLAAQRTDPNVIAIAKCQAVEQIMCEALNEGRVAGPAIAATFRINGTNRQEVVCVEPPSREAV